ncbi:N-acetylglucosaminyl deacetylase, LmbE family [Bacteroides faecichinchillae]|uniref:N-acetylglucosaminyl deacetylase, LmbE family n=1 Tax=Bacteroides faecichinchillae TaxID=871325 RepID=A0A1M5B3U4_9BACE|nr:PIG-L family deacetylase [Bacteroides faecichinchillae]SHF36997.1 N-acetylglucosaminyl deacetylase, LmbE family [Bacteroides faecichinchillae]
MNIIIDFIRRIRVLFIRQLISHKSLFPMPETAFIFAPHPDDEAFGCCGLMQRMMAEGKRVELIIMTGGGKSHSGCCSLSEESLVNERRRLAVKAASIYGLIKERIHFLDFPDGGISKEYLEINRLKTLLNDLLKDNTDVAVFYPHRKGEGWPDHIHTSEIVADLCKEMQTKITQYEYCVWFWFYSCWRIDWKRARILKMNNEEYRYKQQAIDAYILPKAPCGKPWSGVLPDVFVEANRWSRELYFEVR